MLKIEDKYFFYIIEFNIIAMQVRNILRKSYIIFKNFKIEYFKDYNKKNIFYQIRKIFI